MPDSIAVWGGDSVNPYGHVAYVESVEDGVVYYNEANITNYIKGNIGGGYHGHDESMTIKDFERRGKGMGNILGYIYLGGPVNIFTEAVKRHGIGDYKAANELYNLAIDSGLSGNNLKHAKIYIEVGARPSYWVMVPRGSSINRVFKLKENSPSQLNFNIRCKSLTLPSSSIDELSAHLIIEKNNKVLAEKTIRSGDSFIYEGYMIFISSYQTDAIGLVVVAPE